MVDLPHFTVLTRATLCAFFVLTGACKGTGGVTGAPDNPSEASVRLEIVADGLTAPVALVPVPDDTGRLFVVEQTGTIRVLDVDGELLAAPFLDIRDQIVDLNPGYDERGLLGLAFHPDYADNGRLFVYYSAPLRAQAPDRFNHTSRVSEFRGSDDDPHRAAPESEAILMEADQPQTNHNAGQIVFGPDGYLYIPLGDGGGAHDTGVGHVEDWYAFNEGGNGQDLEQNLLGSILRVDVDAGEPYGIPGDNPFVDDPEVADEIWAYGLRNPFRISFDTGGNHELFVGDAGQDRWEDVDIVEAGGNYGWNVKEGTHCFDAAHPKQTLSSCPGTGGRGEPLVDPIIEYPHDVQAGGFGRAVIGGFVYRGEALEGFDGRYIFGDYSSMVHEHDQEHEGAHGSGTLLVASRPNEPGKLWPMHEVNISNRAGGRVGAFILSFGQDLAGELYVLTSDAHGPSGDSGKVYRLAPAS